MAGSTFVAEYLHCLGPNFKVVYAFCISSFLKQQYISNKGKFIFLREHNKANNIEVLFGDDQDYFDKLNAWILHT